MTAPSIDAGSGLVEELRALAASLKRPGGKESRVTKACTRAADALEAQARELAAARREALSLAKILHAEHCAHVTQWQSLDDVAGIISQIDNMTAGLSSDLATAEARIAALESDAREKDEALRLFASADFFCADDPDERVVSIGRWDASFELPRFFADLQITVGDLRRARSALSKGEPHV